MQDIDRAFAVIDQVDAELMEKERELELVEAKLEKLSSYSS